MYEPENIKIHMDLPDCELEDNRTASCPAPDRIATAAPSRAQTPTSSPSDVAAADPHSQGHVATLTVHSGTLRQHMPSLRPAVIGTLQSRTATSNLKRSGSGSR
ncbi:hypothetical protein MRX96_030851 [Rhipicephalus microplus]